MTIKTKLTLVNTLFMIIIVSLVAIFMLYTSEKLIIDNTINNLKETVTESKDSIKYTNGIVNLNNIVFYQNNVYLYAYSDDGILIKSQQSNMPKISDELIDDEITKIKIDDNVYYVYDIFIDNSEFTDIWLRGVITLDDKVVVSNIYYLAFIILPIIVIISAIGSYKISKKAFEPITKIVNTTDKIKKEKDLSLRINLGDKNDEVYNLANTVDEMLDNLENKFQMEREFSSDVSHELRTPTSVILAQCEYALGETLKIDELNNSLTVIERQGKKMLKIINNLLSLTRLDNGVTKLNLEKTDLSELIELICEEQKILKINNITLESNIEKNITIDIDRDLIIRAVNNILNNSYKYGNENGYIKVTLFTDKKDIYLEIKDNGIGISSDNQNKIFRRFYQVDTSRNNTNGSMGLGLSMVDQILKMHKAEIKLTSKLDEGTTFLIKF